MSSADPYLFYTVMDYPLPPRRKCFFYQHDLLLNDDDKDSEQASLTEHDRIPASYPSLYQNELFEQMRKKLIKYRRLRRSIPFLEAVYVWNSMSFNALDQNSDIDVCIVANTWRLWHVRMWSVLLTSLFSIKETAHRRHGKLSLSFTIDKDHGDLHRFKLLPHDPYLIYRIAHLVPIYLRHDDHAFNIFKHNAWILHYLPHHPLRQVIDLWVPITRQRNWWRCSIERLMNWKLWDLTEWLIHILWMPVLYFKRSRSATKEHNTVIGPGVLKFFHDKRAYFALKWKVARDG